VCSWAALGRRGVWGHFTFFHEHGKSLCLMICPTGELPPGLANVLPQLPGVNAWFGSALDKGKYPANPDHPLGLFAGEAKSLHDVLRTVSRGVVEGLASAFAFHGAFPFCSAVRVPSIHATSSPHQGKHGRLGRLDKTGWV